MRMYDLITKKKRGEALTKAEITDIVSGYCKGAIPDFEMAAFFMAVIFRGMEESEVCHLTEALVSRVEKYDVSHIMNFVVDKHSLSGIGDNTTFVLGPLMASLGIGFAKIANHPVQRGYGTRDKLNVFPGIKTEFTGGEFAGRLSQCGIVISGAGSGLSGESRMSALMRLSATEDSIPLMAALLMSKKLSVNSDAIVVDIKVGGASPIKTKEEGLTFSRYITAIGKYFKRPVICALTDFKEPLGYAIGSACEIREAIETLHGKGPKDLTEVVFALGAEILMMAGKAGSKEEAHTLMKQSMDKGHAILKFEEFVESQGSDSQLVKNPKKITLNKCVIGVEANTTGYVTRVSGENMTRGLEILGGLSDTKGRINHGSGIVLHKKIGDKVFPGEILATVYAPDFTNGKEASDIIFKGFDIDVTCPQKNNLIIDIIREDAK